MSDDVKREEVKQEDLKVKYGIAIVLTEEGNVVVRFVEGLEKQVKLQEALGLIELAKFQLIGMAGKGEVETKAEE
jgi:hypothetical protein